jgi:pilus assembly protein CpaE
MSVINPNESSRTWRHYSRTPAVQLFVSDTDGRAGALVGEHAAGFPLSVHPCDPATEIDPASLAGFAAAIVEVAVDDPASVQRFQTLAKRSKTPLIAAVYEAPLALVRSLIRSGAHDVLPLPIDIAEIEASLAPLRDRLTQQSIETAAERGKVVAVIKSAGGAGATSLLGQLAIRHAEREGATGRQACLIDFDVQFGDAAFQLGLHPKLSLMDLIEAGNRLDADLLRATVTEHSSGLKVIAAPSDVLPLESLSSDQVLDVVDLAASEFGTVFLDLPANWANWSLSVLARADLVLLVTEISIPALRQARRQLDLIRSQDLEELEIRVVANRCQPAQFKSIRPADIQAALGRDIAYKITDEEAVMRPAVDRGVPISEIKRKSAIGRDIEQLENGLAAVLGMER